MPQRTMLLRGLAVGRRRAGGSGPGRGGLGPARLGGEGIYGPDVASYQHPHPTEAHPHGQPINWAKVAKAGKTSRSSRPPRARRTSTRTSPGPTPMTTRPRRPPAWYTARTTSPGPDSGVASAKAQAKFFANDDRAGDHEGDTAAGARPRGHRRAQPGQLVAWAQTFLLEMRALTGRTPMLYTYPNFWTTTSATRRAGALPVVDGGVRRACPGLRPLAVHLRCTRQGDRRQRGHVEVRRDQWLPLGNAVERHRGHAVEACRTRCPGPGARQPTRRCGDRVVDAGRHGHRTDHELPRDRIARRRGRRGQRADDLRPRSRPEHADRVHVHGDRDQQGRHQRGIRADAADHAGDPDLVPPRCRDR